MRQRIASGEWTDRLPGERRLADMLQVGRDTVRLMLSELTAEGLITPGKIGVQRRLTNSAAIRQQASQSMRRIGMLSPFKLERLSQNMLTEVDQIRSLLAQRGGSLDLHAPSWYDAPNPSKRLSAFLKAEPCDAWILYRSSRAIQEFFQSSRIPCIIRGYPHQSVELPYVDHDWSATARHAMGELLRNGHRHVGIVMPRDGLRGNVAALQGASSVAEAGIRLTEIWEDGTTEGMIAALIHALKQKDAPTAFITLRPRQAICLLTWMGSQGWQIPKHFSLISLATEALFSSIVPTIATYHIDAAVFAKRVVKRLELLVDGQIAGQSVMLLIPTFVPGASIASQ